MKKILLIALLLSSKLTALVAQCPTGLSIVGNTAVCNNTSVFYNTSISPINGQWSLSSGGTISYPDPISVMVNWSTPGTHELRFTPDFTPGCGNLLPVILSVVVSSSVGSVAPTLITGSQSVCPNTQETYSVPTMGGNTVKWNVMKIGSSSPPPVTVNGNQITVTFNSIGTYTIWAAYDNAVCIGSDSFIRVTSSSGNNSVTITGSSSSCNSSISTFYAYGDITDTFSWSLSSGGILTTSGSKNYIASVQWTTQGSHTLQVTGSNACSSPRNASKQISVGPASLPTPSNLSGPLSACTNTPLNFSINAVAGASSYTWSITPNSGFSILNGTTASPTITFSNKGNYAIAVSANNGFCNSNPATTNVTINSAPTQPSVTGQTRVCLGATYTYSISNPDPTANYQWLIIDSNTLQPASTSQAEFVSASSGTSVQIKFNSGTSHLWISVSALNSCGTSSPFQQLSVNQFHTSTASSIPITGISQACLGTYNYFSDSFNFSSLNWTVSNGGTIQFTGNGYLSVKWNNSGSNTVSVVGTNACGATASASLPVTVSSVIKPSISISGPTNACSGEVSTYSAMPSADISYSWSLNNVSSTG